MKYLFFIMLISTGCRDSWRPKLPKSEKLKADSAVVIDTNKTRLNFVVLENKNYFFIGVKTDSSILKKISDSIMLDSLVRDAKESKKDVAVYGEAAGTYPEFKELFNALKKRELFGFQIVIDDKLKELRIEE